MPNYAVNPAPYSAQPYPYPKYSYPLYQKGFREISTLIFPFFNQVTASITNVIGTFVLYELSAGQSSSVDVSDYNNHVFEFSMYSSGSSVTVSGSATGSLYVSSSIDGLNWVGEFSTVISVYTASISSTASFVRLTGRRRYFLASYLVAGSSSKLNNTASLYLLSGQ